MTCSGMARWYWPARAARAWAPKNRTLELIQRGIGLTRARAIDVVWRAGGKTFEKRLGGVKTVVMNASVSPWLLTPENTCDNAPELVLTMILS